MAPDAAPAKTKEQPAKTAPTGDKPKPTKKVHKLIRPRGKRGGAKNRKKTSSATGKQDKSKKSTEQSDHAQKIAEFHTLTKRLAQAKAQLGKPGAVQAQLQVDELEAQLSDLAAYQEQSLRGKNLHNAGETSKWFIKAFGPEWAAYQEANGKRRARLLDVGALSGTAYKKYGIVDATSIDLNPQGDLVQKADFFKLEPPEGTEEDPKFDVVSLSLVINFVGDLFDRGEMLIRPHKFLTEHGYVFLALPLACVSNSRYLDHDTLRSIISHAEYDVVTQEDSAKLTRWLLHRKEVEDGEAKWDGTTFKKTELPNRVGAAYNNFCIRLGKPVAGQPAPAAKSKQGEEQNESDDDEAENDVAMSD